MKRKFYQISTADRVASIDIYGDITSWKWYESDVCASDIKKEIDALDVDRIDVYINSYGGEVAEALAIYTALKRHSASVHTYCDGFACSAATIIFCAGDVRTMGSIALLMIHNCMSYLGYANSSEMRKAADDNDKINQSSVEAYKAVANISEDEIKAMMEAETWLTAEECLKYGFATEIAEKEEDEDEGSQQSVKMAIRKAVLAETGQNPQENVFDEIKDMLQEIKDAVVDPDDDDGDDPDGGEGDDGGNAEPDDPEEDPDDDTSDEDDEEKTNQKAAAFFGSLF
ncbi:MAG: head maturation protease, ClpP-related [Anaerovoracaceae bacterium]